MLFRKTPTSERDNYVYRFNDGTVSVIAEGDEATVWIKSLHSFDDAEVYNNINNSRPQREPWQKKALEEWKAQHPGEVPEKNWKFPLESEVEAVMEKKNGFMAKIAELKRCSEVLVVILETLMETFSGIDTEPVKIFCTAFKVIIIISSIIMWVRTIIHKHRKKKNKDCEERVSEKEEALQ